MSGILDSYSRTLSDQECSVENLKWFTSSVAPTQDGWGMNGVLAKSLSVATFMFSVFQLNIYFEVASFSIKEQSFHLAKL